MKLRGRIINDPVSSGLHVAIVTPIRSRKSYTITEFGTNTRECKVYTTIWNVWWERCEEDEMFNKRCITEYEDYRKTGRK